MTSTEKLLRDLELRLQSDQSDLRKWNVYYFNVHKKRYLNDVKIFQTYYHGGRVLEIGSAPYHVTYLLNHLAENLVGLDLAHERHRDLIRDLQLNIVSCNIETELLPFPDQTFSYILLNEVFEHLRINPIRTLKEIHRVLHPDGFLTLTTPNLYSIQNIVNFLLGKGFDNPFQEFRKLDTLGQMGHVREYSVPQVKSFLENTGFMPVSVERHSYNPLRGYLAPFNLVRKVFPRYHTFQVHLCKKGVIPESGGEQKSY